MSAKHDLSLGDRSALLDVILTRHLTFLNGWIDGSLGVFEGLLGPHADVQFVGIGVGDVVSLHKHISNVSDVLPVAVAKWKVGIAGVLVTDGVPNGVQVLSSLVVWQVDGVTSTVALGELVVHSGGRVQWLMEVTDVVDDKSQRSRLAILLRVILVSVLHDQLVLVGVLISIGTLEPVCQSVDNLSDVVVVHGEVEVVEAATLVEEWLVDKVPSNLVLSLWLTLDKVGIGGALSEWMILLILSPVWIGILEGLQDGEDFIVSIWILLFQDNLGNSCSEQVTMVPPGTRKREQHAYDKQ